MSHMKDNFLFFQILSNSFKMSFALVVGEGGIGSADGKTIQQFVLLRWHSGERVQELRGLRGWKVRNPMMKTQ